MSRNQPSSPFCLPPEIKKQGAKLFDQQMWCWGYDIRATEGNILLQYGFSRQRLPEGASGSSAYTLDDMHHRNVALWGFGLFYRENEDDGLFLRRFSFQPRRVLREVETLHVYESSQLGYLHLPQKDEERMATLSLFVRVMRWVSAYEQWVQTRMSSSYRQDSLQGWKKRTIPPDEIISTWNWLADQCEQLVGI
jgi:hypothetical protein